MDNSPGSDDRMDWKEDSSLHIIQPASGPWRKRSFDTYNDANEPYHAQDLYSGYQVTDTLRNQAEVVAPFIDSEGRPAQYVTDANGNIILQPIIQQQPRPPIGYYLPEVVKWLIYGVTLLVCGSIELAGDAYIHTATVAVRAGNDAKRRLVEVARKRFAPAPPSPRRHHDVPHHRRQSPILRRISPTTPGGRTHIPVTPPRKRPRPTPREIPTVNNECLVDRTPSSAEHVSSDAFTASHEDDHLMSGALQDIDMDEDSPSNVSSSSPSYEVPGTFPYSPAPPPLPSNKSSTPDSQASGNFAASHNLKPNDMTTSDAQATEDLSALHSEPYEEPDIPEVKPIAKSSLRQIDSRPRNYRGELLDDWQIKICSQFQAIHPPPREIRPPTTEILEQPQGLDGTRLTKSRWSSLADEQPIISHQQHETTATRLIDPSRSPVAKVSQMGAAVGILDPHGSTAERLDRPHGMTSIGLNDSPRSPLNLPEALRENSHSPPVLSSIGSSDLHRSPLDIHRATNEVPRHPHVPTSMGLNDLYRSPLDVHKATTDALPQPRGKPSIGLNDLHQSPLADVSPTRSGEVPREQLDKTPNISHEPPRTATIGSVSSPQSPLAILSSVNSLCESSSLDLINSTRSPSDDASPVYIQHEMSPTGSCSESGSPLSASLMEAAVNATIDRCGNGHDGSESVTHMPLKSLSTSPPVTATPAAKSPSIWSIRSLYARVSGRQKKRSPLCELVNHGNIHKVPKTPKKVTWPKNGPVTATKRFLKHEPMSYPSPTSSRENSSILSSVPSDFSPQPSPTMQEEEELSVLDAPNQGCSSKSTDGDWRVSPTSTNSNDVLKPAPTNEHADIILKSSEEQSITSSSSSDNEASILSVPTPTKTATEEPSTPSSQLGPKLEELSISTRRSSLRRREKEDHAQRLRDAAAAEEKARKEKQEAEEKARKEKEEAEERARIKAQEEEERKKTGGRRMPIERVIQSLPPGWDEKIRINMAKGMGQQLAMTSVGNPLTRRDFGMILPQPRTEDDPSGWLNDEIISGYLQAVVDHGHRAMGHPRGAKPRMHAHTPFFYTTLKERGYDGVKRWSNRAKIGGNDLKSVEYVFIPCNPSKSHWTLIVVSPIRKTIEVFDSMHGDSSDKVKTTKTWLRGEMGHSYVDSEWTVVDDPKYPGRGKGPVQDNANDCGVFAVTTAKMIVLGVDPMAVSARDMPLQRRRLAAELLNGGFSGEFEPLVVFE